MSLSANERDPSNTHFSTRFTEESTEKEELSETPYKMCTELKTPEDCIEALELQPLTHNDWASISATAHQRQREIVPEMLKKMTTSKV